MLSVSYVTPVCLVFLFFGYFFLYHYFCFPSPIRSLVPILFFSFFTFLFLYPSPVVISFFLYFLFFLDPSPFLFPSFFLSATFTWRPKKEKYKPFVLGGAKREAEAVEIGGRKKEREKWRKEKKKMNDV